MKKVNEASFSPKIGPVLFDNDELYFTITLSST